MKSTQRPIGRRPRPLRVAYITQSLARDRHLNALVDHSDPERVQYSVIALGGELGPLSADMSSRSVAVRSLELSQVTLEQVPFAAIRLRAALRRDRPDVIHSILFYSALATELARATLSAPPPSLLARHHEMRLHLSRKRLHVRLDRWMALRATRVAAASQAVRRVLTDHEGVPHEHVAVILYGLNWNEVVVPDPIRTRAWKQRFGTERLLVAAGRLAPEKDYPTLLRAFAEVTRNHPDAHLAIAGTGALRGELELLVSRLDLVSRVTFLGWVDDIYDLVAGADVFVQASTDEALPQTIMEAAGLSVPVVATTVGGAPEILDPAARQVEAGDHGGLAAEISAVLSSLDGARTRARTHAKTVRARFDASRMADEYAATYEAISRRGLTGSDQTSSARESRDSG